MNEQLEMFATPAQTASAEYRDELAAWMAERAVDGGWRCHVCGRIEPTTWALLNNHGRGRRDGWCYRLYLRRNHARYALLTGDLALWVTAAADLRQIAAWRAGR